MGALYRRVSKFFRDVSSTIVGSMARAVADRGCSSSRAISPKKSPSLCTDSTNSSSPSNFFVISILPR